jgi:multiple sugar transport system permease protein
MTLFNKRKLKRSRLVYQESKWGFIFISPWIVGFVIFYVIPMLASFGFSLFKFNLLTPDERQFSGLENWKRMVVDDPEVLASVVKIFKFGLITLPISMGVALFLAILLNSQHLFEKAVFRTLFYMPTVIPLVATVLIWNGVLNEYTGWLNLLLEYGLGIKAVGEKGIRWLHEPSLIYFAYSMINLWGIGNTLLILLAGLQNIPTELYEASFVDGAGWWRRLVHITLPMLSPVIFYNLVIGMIILMQYFLVPYTLAPGTTAYPGYPQGSTNFIMVYFYKQAFTFFNMGYGAAIAWVLFLIALIFTLILFGTAKYWVYYAGEKR